MIQSTLPLPIHVALIMDGNGRWAERRGQPRWTGHQAGVAAVRTAVSQCARRGVRQLTLYAFSSDNWKRPVPEVTAILGLCERQLRLEADALARDGIRTTAIGRRDRIPAALRRAIEDIEERTADGRRMELRIALDYSSREAIASSLAMPEPRIGTQIGTPIGTRPSRAVTVLPRGAEHRGSTIIPPVDLLLRTGGERRLSDFLLWECAYAELVFLDLLFPDLTAADIDRVLAEYASRERRFGAIPARATA